MKKWFFSNYPFSPKKFPFFYGWVLLLAGVFGLVIGLPGHSICLSPFTDPLLASLKISRVNYTSAFMFGTIVAGVCLPYGGRLYDKYGARLTGVLASIAMGMTLLFLASISLIAKYSDYSLYAIFPALLIGFACVRLVGQGLLELLCRSMIAKWFKSNRGKVFAGIGCFTTIGYCFSPSFLHALVAKLGWSYTWGAIGFLLIFIGTPIIWLFFRDNPEECGLQVDGLGGENHRTPPAAIADKTLKEAVKTLHFWVINLGIAAASAISSGLSLNLASIAHEFGIDPATIFKAYIPMAFVTIASNFVMGWLSDRTSLKNIFIIMGCCLVLSLIGILSLNSPWGMRLYIASNGIIWSCYAILKSISWIRLFGRSHLGSINGFSIATTVLLSACAPLAYGTSKELTNSYIPAIICSILIPLSLLILSLRIKE